MLVIAGKFGRLGNQLWTYANVLAFALEHGLRVTNLTFDARALFRGTTGLVHSAADVPPGKAWRMCMRGLYKANLRVRMFPFVNLGEADLLDMDAQPRIAAAMQSHALNFLSGFYFQAPRSMQAQAGRVREFFSLEPALAARASALVARARAHADLLVGVHIRHGDYRTYSDGVMYYSPAEYAEVMHGIVQQASGRSVAFLICSDERQDLSHFQGLRVLQSGETPVVDMYALAGCDCIFGPNSSFSHWASFWGSVPLHILDWRAAERFGDRPAIRQPRLDTHFQRFGAEQFGTYAERRIDWEGALA